jgi:3-(3-hydroxy-phenyl)propionate hydroxylase
MNQTVQSGYKLPTYDFVLPKELKTDSDQSQSTHYPVIIVGAGLAGLTAAADLASKGIQVLLVDEDDTVGVRGASSRGICYAQKSLEIFERLGTYQRIQEKGIQWSVGKTLAGNDVVYSFDLAKQISHNASKQPPFINLQQFYIEWFLVDLLNELEQVDLRWKTTLTSVSQDDSGVQITLACPAGHYSVSTDWLIDATGIRSPIREHFELRTNPAVGEDRWCISDVRFKHKPPIERWTWVEAPFNENRAVWQHLMGDDVWRLDYQMAPDADPSLISSPEVVSERLRAQFGPEIDFELVWVGPYGYRSHVLEQMRLKRILFLGDSAHVMSPFGARGGNSAIQDADNLGWKLALVLKGLLPPSYLDSYHSERHFAAEQNVAITNRTMRFLTPITAMEKVFRKAVIELAKRYEFAQALVNTGRLSTPTEYGHPFSQKPKKQLLDNQAVPHSDDSIDLITGLSVANCVMSSPSKPAKDLVELMRSEGGKICLLCVDSKAFDLAAGLAKRFPAFVAKYVELADMQNKDTKLVIQTWRDSTGFLAGKLNLQLGHVGLLRPDLHSQGTVKVDQLSSYLERTFNLSALETTGL